MIAIVCTARASYAKLRPIISGVLALGERPLLYLGSGAVLERFGNLARQVPLDFPGISGIEPRIIDSEFDGYTPGASAKSTAALMSSLADCFSHDKPSLVVVNHDRREVVAVAQSAAYLNIPVAHIGAGERTGSIDDRCRDAITHLSDYYFPATRLSAFRTYSLTGTWEPIHWYGCPSIDIAKRALDDPPVTETEISGSGPAVDPAYPFLLCLQHPDTTTYADSYQQMWATLTALERSNMPVLLQWPGADSGTTEMAKAIRVFREQHPAFSLRTIPNLAPERYLRLLKQATVLVGNSSSGIREASYIGTPVVNIGDRQAGRERGPNVVDMRYDATAIQLAIAAQRQHGPYRSVELYGKGDSGRQIAEKLAELA